MAFKKLESWVLGSITVLLSRFSLKIPKKNQIYFRPIKLFVHSRSKNTAKMASKQKKPIPHKGTPSHKNNVVYFDYSDFKNRHSSKFLFVAAVAALLFAVSLFKNIAYPLFWADESMTAMGSARVLQFGYPKVHDGKNIFYDLKYSNDTLGINGEDDAYIGGTNWGHYYYGTIGYKLAEKADDLYEKTAVYRSTFALAGLLGLMLLAIFLSRLFADTFTRYAFISLFFLLELSCISLVILLKEVRYYALVMLLLGVILGLYARFRFYKPSNSVVYVAVQSVALWLLFMTFAPAFFITVMCLGISEVVVGLHQWTTSNLTAAIKKSVPGVLPSAIALVFVYPLLSYFKTFEISKALSDYNEFNSKMYWEHVYYVVNYFKKFELLWLAIALKSWTWLHAKAFFREKNMLFRASTFLSLFVVVYILAIAKIPNIIYTRYIIYLQPIVSAIILIDLFTLIKHYSRTSTRLLSAKMLAPALVFSGFFAYSVSKNLPYLKGHIFEMTHPYKGPLDYTIPYIKAQYPASDTLIIATNYEETSYMYYLNSKVTVGYVGNNLREDSLTQPHIIAYRKWWGNYVDVFNGFTSKAPYEPVKFPIKGSPVNNIPEFNLMPPLVHQFEELPAANDKDATYLFIRKQ
jgi:hypothetical protein